MILIGCKITEISSENGEKVLFSQKKVCRASCKKGVAGVMSFDRSKEVKIL